MKRILVLSLIVLGAYRALGVSFTFNKAYIGVGTNYALETNSISIGTPINSTSYTFTSLNPNDVTFSGNNVAGTLTYTVNGVLQTINAVITRPVKSGNTDQALYMVEVNPAGSNTTTGIAYFLILPGFESVFTNNSTIGSSSDPVDAVLNAVVYVFKQVGLLTKE